MNRKVTTILKEIMVDNVVLEGDALVNHVNNYFVSIAASICAGVPVTQVFTCLAPPVLVSCFFHPASVNEVAGIIKKTKKQR